LSPGSCDSPDLIGRLATNSERKDIFTANDLFNRGLQLLREGALICDRWILRKTPQMSLAGDLRTVGA